MVGHLNSPFNFNKNNLQPFPEESYRNLWTRIQLLERPPKTLLVTSPRPMESKTTLVVNLGIIIAQAGVEVLLVDADLKQPKMHEFCCLNNTRGLTDILTMGLGIESVLQKLDQGPSIITSGLLSPRPITFNGSPEMKRFMERATSSFEVILIDSSPILQATDAVFIVSLVDGVILTLNIGATSEQDAKQAKVLLENANAQLIGVVLTNARSA